MIASTLALLLAAQNPTGDTEPQSHITVTAPRVATEAVVSRYVRDISSTADGQLASLRAPVCPAVFGIPENYADNVVRRIRRVAQQAGARVADPGCTPNVTLIVANNATSAVEELRRHRPRLFDGMPNSENRGLTDGNAPVRAWSISEIQNEDGGDYRPSSDSESGRSGGNPSQAAVLRVRSASIMRVPTVRLITQSIIVMEEQAMIGKTLTQIADYVAMRGIAGTRDGASMGAGNSILSLFDSSAETPRSLTSIDMAYLRALMSSRGNQRANTHMARISEQILEEVGGASRP